MIVRRAAGKLAERRKSQSPVLVDLIEAKAGKMIWPGAEGGVVVVEITAIFCRLTWDNIYHPSNRAGSIKRRAAAFDDFDLLHQGHRDLLNSIDRGQR